MTPNIPSGKVNQALRNRVYAGAAERTGIPLSTRHHGVKPLTGEMLKPRGTAVGFSAVPGRQERRAAGRKVGGA